MSSSPSHPEDRTLVEAPAEHRAHSRVYFHLLTDLDLRHLRPVFEAALKRRGEIIGHWYSQYVSRFSDSRALGEPEFTQIFEPRLERGYTALLTGDMDRYGAEMMQVGRLAAQRGMPLEEGVALFHLFKQSVRSCVSPHVSWTSEMEGAFDRLSDTRVLLLVSAYFSSHSLVSSGLISAGEREVDGIPSTARSRFHGLVGASASMRSLYDRIELAGGTNSNLLIVGESGTGKELVARAIHECGNRKERPFIALNCAALPKELIESELFGYKRGAFSGANNDHLGLFRSAEGGTLFLDEITEMDATTQSKLLRAIQERAIRPVGSTQEQPIDVRLIAATNRDPQKAVEHGYLRADLYYRLQASVLNIEPLREHPEDIPLLVEHFIAIFKQRLGRNVVGIEKTALDIFMHYSWPGNVRELANVIESSFTFGKTPLISVSDLPIEMVRFERQAERRLPELDGEVPRVPSYAEAECELIVGALKSTRGNKVAAAAQLGISRKKLYAKIQKYGLASHPFLKRLSVP